MWTSFSTSFRCNVVETPAGKEIKDEQESLPDPNPEMLVFSGSRSNVNLTAFPRSSSYLRSLTKCWKKNRDNPVKITASMMCQVFSFALLLQLICLVFGKWAFSCAFQVKHCEMETDEDKLKHKCCECTLMSARSSVSCSSDMDADWSVSRLSSSALFCRASKMTTETQQQSISFNCFQCTNLLF